MWRNGEFHTFVYDSPAFRRPLTVKMLYGCQHGIVSRGIASQQRLHIAQQVVVSCAGFLEKCGTLRRRQIGRRMK